MPKYKFTPEQLSAAEESGLLNDRQKNILEMFYRRGWRIQDIAASIYFERRTVCRELAHIRSVIRQTESH